MKTTRQIKSLKTQVRLLNEEAKELKEDFSEKQRVYGNMLKKIRDLKDKIDRMESKEDIRVSEHAIVRYFERVKGFDIDAIEKEILSGQVKDQVSKLGGNGTYPNKQFSVVMKNYTVTTVI